MERKRGLSDVVNEIIFLYTKKRGAGRVNPGQLKMKKQNLQASLTPQEDVNRAAYAGQPVFMRMYHPGYEAFMNQMPVLEPDDPFLPEKIDFTRELMVRLGGAIKVDPVLNQGATARAGEFNRIILAIESSVNELAGNTEPGNELILARWGTGFSSPVHGHVPGYHHEEVIRGRLRVNLYQMVQSGAAVARPFKTFIQGPGTLASEYIRCLPGEPLPRTAAIHSFTALEPSDTLHYLTEHSRDGRDNAFAIEYWDEVYQPTREDFNQVDTFDGMFLQKGDVALVRSANVPEYGDHYIVITGPAIVKPHGLRPQDEAIHAPTMGHVLDQYTPKNGVVLLQLNKRATADFLKFHNISVSAGEVVFQEAIPLTV